MLAFIVRRLTISGFKDPRFPIVNCWTRPWEYMGIPCQLWLNVACGNGCRGGNGGCSSSDGNNGGVSDGVVFIVVMIAEIVVYDKLLKYL